MRLVLLICGMMLYGIGNLEAQTSQPHETDSPLPATVAARTAKVPAGFNVTVFAGEPAVKQPIGFCQDDRGRLWVAEAYNYPVHGTKAGDRIIILEDTDGDGRHDQRKVFFEGLNYVTGIEVGHGGAWVMSPPNFYFIPDRDHDDQPDGEPVILLNGFGNHANAHNLANGFAWGPDGWLYGTHGRTNWSNIGKPGTPPEQRTRFDGGVYRYHPLTHRWEPYADGTTNPWGIDWNDYGHAFITNCVNPHLFQVIQGAHYEPWRGRKSSQYAYQRIDTIADHLHFVGGNDVRAGIGSAEEDTIGGGHAHCGAMIYLGDSFPDHYRNTLFTNNIHGRRINNDIPIRKGSGYTASHAPDLFRSADPWFMGVNLTYGPSGEVYVSDWSDTGECHSTVNTRRHTGRIYRITHGDAKSRRIDLAKRSNTELVELQLHKNDWHVRHARRLLQERAAKGDDMSAVHLGLKSMFDSQTEIPRKLRALWALHVTGGLDDQFLTKALDHPNEDIRSWAITLLCEDKNPPKAVMDRFIELAKDGDSPLVRLSLASALQRLPLRKRWQLAEPLCQRLEDVTDQNLPLMIWYAVEPLIEEDLPRFVNLAATTKIPRVRINAARRIASSMIADQGLALLAREISAGTPSDVSKELLEGILLGSRGKRKIQMPPEWSDALQRLWKSGDKQLENEATRLAVVFRDPLAFRRLRKLAHSPLAQVNDREAAITTLVDQRVPNFDGDLIRLLQDPKVRSAALRGLAAFNHPRTANTILEMYDSLSISERQNAQMTLVSRQPWAEKLLAAIESNQIEASELTAYSARQIRSLSDDELTQRLTKCWGDVRETSKEKSRQIRRLERRLRNQDLAKADLGNGQQLFKKHCASCHRFFGDGGDIGPDITGSQRMNLAYMLENILDPNAAVAKDYQIEIFQTVDGRLITGLVNAETDETITIQTVNERLVLPIDEIESRKKSTLSIMPEGLLDPLSESDIIDLMGFLQSKH